jgi:biopolymer transport protein ExbB
MDAVKVYIEQGGLFMYPIIGGCLWALTLLLERAIFFMRQATALQAQSQRFFTLLEQQGLEDAATYLKGRTGILTRVLGIALDNTDKSPQRIEEKMGTVLLAELPAFSKYLNLIGALAGMMPILGLLGTVTGMIATFKVIALQGTGDAQAMASGISEALITTQAGLVAAVPLLLGHTLLSNRLKRISDKTRESCTLLLDFIKERYAQQSI